MFSCANMRVQNSVASSCVSLQVLAISRYCVELAANALRATKFSIAHIFATNHWGGDFWQKELEALRRNPLWYRGYITFVRFSPYKIKAQQ